MRLIEKIKRELDSKERTIPELCKRFNVDDEYDMMDAIADLEYSGDIVLHSFDKIYREDGGAIYLAKYARITS